MTSVSAIVAVYNDEVYLASALESILTQTRPPAEVIVVDDGSTNRTADIARSFREVRYLRQANAGQPVAMNLGIRASTGAFLAFLDADDLWSESKLALQLAAFSERPELDIVFGHARQFVDASAGGGLRLSADREVLPARVPGAALLRRSTFERIGTFRADLRVASAIEWYARARHAGMNELVLDAVLLHRRIHRSNAGKASKHPEGYFAAIRAALGKGP